MSSENITYYVNYFEIKVHFKNLKSRKNFQKTIKINK